MRSIFAKLGIDYDIMKLIIKHKMIMDKRRDEGSKNYLLSSVIVYFIMGLFFAPIVGMYIDNYIKMSVFFSVFMIMILNVFITDFSSVILDVKDKDILLTKGVDNKTLNAAKFAHIIIYIGILSLSISGGSIIISFRFGITFALLLIVSIFLIDIFMLIITAIMYTSILKLFSGEKLKDIINVFQILFLLIFVIGFQFVERAFNISDLQFVYDQQLWNILVPPMWFAANFDLLQGEGINDIIKIMSVLSIVVPLISIIIYIKLVPVFENNLQKLNNNSDKSKKTNRRVYMKVSKLLCKDNEERIFFNFIYDILSKDRDFKLKVYSSLSMAIFMPLIMILSSYDKEGILNYINSISNTDYYFSAYLCLIIAQNVITLIKFSKEYEGAWIYNVLPIKNEKNIYSAMFKASIFKFILPMFIVLGIIFILIFKINILIDMVIIFVANIVILMFTLKMDKKDLPFSIEYKNISSSSNIITMLKSMFIVCIFAGLHYLVRKNMLFKLLYLIFISLFVNIIYNKMFN